ncbi:hypothetical protein [Streptomyces sp. NPDC014733]|uniref:hypothetical protein n=1 Tax=Streptomyces sp. NPDC014733 TaxID=3364885 RepID=UPI0037015253
MTDAILAALQNFQQYAAGLQGLLAEARSGVPAGAEGQDEARAVTVRVGSDGLPETVTLARDWQRKRTPETIGGAVTEAYGAAMHRSMAAMQEAMDGADVQGRAEELRQERERRSREHPRTAPGTPGSGAGPSGGAPGEGAPPVEVPGRDLRHVVPRPIDEVAEEMIAAFDAVAGMDLESVAGARVEGRDPGNRVTVELSKGAFHSCRVDAAWAEGKSAVSLGQAVAAALADGRASLARLEESSGADAQGQLLDGLLDEALAILRDPKRFTGGL